MPKPSKAKSASKAKSKGRKKKPPEKHRLETREHFEAELKDEDRKMLTKDLLDEQWKYIETL